MSSKTRVIVDLDAGSDDAHALCILLHAEKIGKIIIEAICCSMGNSSVDHICKNVVRILETVKRTDIPIYKGCSGPILPMESPIPKFYGDDGFGDLIYDEEPDLSIIKKTPSAIAMSEIGEKYPGEVTLVCLGPLTNVALALRLFDNFKKNIKEIHLMGGNYTAVGNITCTAEYNFYIDPEAAYAVLESVICPVYMCTWESCLKTNISLNWRWNKLGKVQHPIVKLITNVEKSIYSKESKTSKWLPCDAFLAAALIYPEKLIKKKSQHRASVELHGSQTRAQIVLDHLKIKEPNVTVIEKVDSDFFKDLILEVYESFNKT
ncbi:uncharacterized protein LOC108736602 [Agrilus planipennis]|uniref:Uncharacterized protein LOC108736602 n=1 Tax=Agrilus planipennis TaxID=224129 RepID=A0A1W4WWZ1_AGRPL|nr:uncharacterized protein LOC108736602 [Agrilus planipennis]